jgi:hypothetical protein
MEKKEILHLNLMRKYFDEIASGEKRQEYRAYKPYWKKRLEGRDYDEIEFRNGFLPDSRRMRVKYLGLERDGNDYGIRLGKILRKPWRPRG